MWGPRQNNYGPKTPKFGRFRELIANISGTKQDTFKWNTALHITITHACVAYRYLS